MHYSKYSAARDWKNIINCHLYVINVINIFDDYLLKLFENNYSKNGIKLINIKRLIYLILKYIQLSMNNIVNS